MKTFVLVHGGWHGGWCWARVARILRSHGYDVFTPTLTGLGERAHLLSSSTTLQTGIEDIVGVLEAEELRDVILVGHSAGAATVSGVADRVQEKIRSLVFLDGLILQDGESLRSHFTPPQEEAYQAALKAGDNSFPPPPAAMFMVPEGPDADWVNRRLTPQPFATASSTLRLKHGLGNGKSCTYIACSAPVHPFVAGSHRFAQEQVGWQWREINAGHDAMITAPELVTQTLENLD